MAINFPDSPTLNQTFQQADRAWQWDGEKWKSTGTTSSSTVGATVVFEGATDDAYETTLTATDPTADRTITLPNASGTVAFTSDIPTVAGVYAPLASPEFTGNVTMQSLDMDDIVAGDVIYGSGADTLARLAKGSDDEVLTLASGVPSWAAIPAAASDEIVDADNDTKIQVEESADEDKIRFDTGGTERMVIDNSTSPAVRLPNATTSGVHFNMAVNGQSASTGRFYGIGFDAESNLDRYKVAVGVEGNGGYSYGKFHILNKPDHDSGNPADLTDAVLTAHGDGTIELPRGNLKVASGQGIDFSATSDASGMASELLDNYEEGTWTYSLVTQSGSITMDSGWDTGSYVRVGRLVSVTGQFYIGSKSSPSGWIYMTGLPYNIESLAEHSEEFVSLAPANCLTQELNTLVYVGTTNSNSAWIYGTWGGVTNGATNSPASLFAATGPIGICLTYYCVA